MMNIRILYGVIAVLLIIVIVFYMMYGSVWDKYMEGMWKSTEEFAQQASIDVAWMYLGDKSAHNVRKGYLIMYGDGEIIFNKKFKLVMRPGLGTITPVVRSVKLVFDEPDENIPENLTMNLDLIDGKLILCDGDDIYLSVIKNNEDSEYGKSVAE